MHRALTTTAAILVLAACTTDPYTGERQVSRGAAGAAIGAVLGAGIGALTNTSSGEQAAKNAAIGAGIGALAGGGVGLYMDRQESRLRQELQGTGVQVVRNGNQIQLIMPGNITFDTGSAAVRAQFYPVLNSVQKVLDEFEKTIVVVEGHTDNVGGADFNQQLSVNRANSVAAYLLQHRGIKPQRFVIRGYGESRPIASNDSDFGRQQNRRVEIQLSPLTA